LEGMAKFEFAKQTTTRRAAEFTTESTPEITK
jgi:hypothetical protein